MVHYRRQRRRSSAGRRGRRRGRQGESSGMGTRAPHHSLAGASLGRQIGARGHRISYEGGGGSEIDRVTSPVLHPRADAVGDQLCPALAAPGIVRPLACPQVVGITPSGFRVSAGR
jgi:hypothetical protein